MNKKGEIIMNRLKTIGLSALAGSLAVVSANAVELSVTGKTEVTYVQHDKANTGNPFGFGNAITFAGSGDVNGYTATYTAVIGDGAQANSNTSEVFASSSLMLDMGDMGTVGIDQGVGEFGVGTIDDKMPYAYEEIWTYTGAGNGLRAAGGTNAVGYKNSFGGYNLSVEINKGTRGATGAKGGSGDGGSTGAGVTTKGVNWAVTGEVAPGLNMGIGDGDESSLAENSYQTAFATYAIGGATVGDQLSSGTGGSAGTASNEVELYGISFAVNENLAISYNEMEREIGKASVVHVTEDTKGIGASYTMGSASVRVLQAKTDNVGGQSGKEESHMEISLMLAF